MRKKLINIVFLILPLASFCQIKRDSIYLFEVGYEVVYYSLDSINNNEVIGYYINDTSNVALIKKYKKGRLNGKTKVYYPSKEIFSEINYKNGKYHGEILRYNEDGTIAGKWNYKKGIQHGWTKLYAPWGCWSKTKYKNGKANKTMISDPPF